MVPWSALSLALQNVSVLKIMFQSHETFALFFKNAATLVNLKELDFSLNNSTRSSYLSPPSHLPTFPNLHTLMIHQLNKLVLSSIPLFLPKLRLLWSDNREDVLDLDLLVEWPRDALWPIHQYFDYASIRYLSITLDNKFGQNLRIVGSEIYDGTCSTYDRASSSVIPAREGMGKRFEFSLDVLGDPAFGVLPYMCTVLKKMSNLLEIVVELRFSELRMSLESTRLHHFIDPEEVGYDEISIGLEESVDLLEESVYLVKIFEVLQQESICVCLESISLNYDPQRYLRYSNDFDKKGNVAGGGPIVDLLLNVLKARRNVLKHLFLENWLPLGETHLNQLKSWGIEVVEYPRII
ncbi:hypothetical protein Clacol_000789 [Clathrus columnatus]|uniref:Uncharacterized protein n=1 Tax=Clathrus columnatus TaxID=1419009 RepID=A0AAV5A0P5_9AGAM|nr:hypothetical protein Clacol_000789 [Clathrus columnatus]